jgi:cytochrome P450
MASRPIPAPDGLLGLQALRAIFAERSPLGALKVFHAGLGDVFRLRLAGFNAVMLVGLEANRFVLVDERENLLWRNEHDPVTDLLRHGLLVEDGQAHDALRSLMDPPLHKRMMESYIAQMWRAADQVSAGWGRGGRFDMVDEMRKIALLALMSTLYREDFTPYLDSLWEAVERVVAYISPGVWIIWRNAPRPGFKRPLAQMDAYLLALIRARRQNLGPTDDLLGGLIAGGLSDEHIRDQLLTILIAGHDTSMALLSWLLHVLATYPEVAQRLQDEVDSVLGSAPPTYAHLKALPYLEQVLKETLRVYPALHLGSRLAAQDLEFQGYALPRGTRVMYSIYLTHHHPDYWPEPSRFDPERFSPQREKDIQPFTYLPFGWGKRNCIGALFGQVEAKIVLARLLQKWEFRSVGEKVYIKMAATLEPYPHLHLEAIAR